MCAYVFMALYVQVKEDNHTGTIEERKLYVCWNQFMNNPEDNLPILTSERRQSGEMAEKKPFYVWWCMAEDT